MKFLNNISDSGMINEVIDKRFVTDAEKSTWNSKSDTDTVTTINGNTGAISKADIVALGIPAQDTTIASGVSIADVSGNYTSTNVEGALSELFTSVSSGKTLIAGAITDKGVETSATDTFSTMATNISSISGGGAPIAVLPEAVNFYDYDGSLVASWTLAELASAVSLPANPSHAGLTAQGWNWTLADLKTENRAIDVGQMYITSDGKTKLYITIAAVGRMTVPLIWSQSVDSGVTIDWGDGSTPETFTGTGTKDTTHVYAEIGDYVISLEVTAGVLWLGYGSSSGCVLGATSIAGRVYNNMLQKVEIGSGVPGFGTSVFQNCTSLASVVIPSSVTSIGTNAFQNCYSLASVIIPSGVTSIGNTVFQNCYTLASVVIPSGVTSIGNTVFQNCYSLPSVIIPNSVKSIGTSAFQNCPSLAAVIIPSSVKSIGNSAFYNCYSLAAVIIPSSVTSIGNSAFYYCYSLAAVIIPNSVTSIGTTAFQSCTGMAEYHFQRTTPPTLASTNSFTSIPADCKIYVPLASLAAYQAATNWATYAAYMIGE